jgi:hypothetical protein
LWRPALAGPRRIRCERRSLTPTFHAMTMTTFAPTAPPNPGAADAVVRDLQGQLLHARNDDGGWPYHPGKSSRLEPTCWALLALADHPARASVLDTLLGWRMAGGLFVEGPSGQVNHTFNGLAAVALPCGGPAGDTAAEAIAARLLGVKGLKARNVKEIGQDSTLQGWPWIDGTFSWVGPTSWCLLALKRRRPNLPAKPAQARIDEAEHLLIDRACHEGGWNYGNPLVLDKALRPHLPTTAEALIAMQDRADDPVVARAARWLHDRQLSEPSAMTLSLAALACRLHDIDTAAIEGRLAVEIDSPRSARGHVALAVAACALRGGAGVAPFRL